jgi:signal transduction histidine kinase
VELAQNLSGRAALAVENARLYRSSREAIRMRDDFLTVASHELNTPTTSLLLTLDYLQSHGVTEMSAEEADRMIGRAVRQCRILRSLVAQLLDTSRAQTDALVLERGESVDLAAIARKVIERMRPELESSGSTCAYSGAERAVGDWDRDRIDLVVSCLLSNAIKFGEGKPIEVRVEEGKHVTRLAVRDQGRGIPAEAMDRIFERHTRAVPHQHYGGLGIGLYVARAVVDAHDGSLTVESREGKGTTFTVELPRRIT